MGFKVGSGILKKLQTAEIRGMLKGLNEQKEAFFERPTRLLLLLLKEANHAGEI